jgi:diketogulonate reductase-like aldo/keto reductase
MEEFMDAIITRGVSIPRLGFGTFRMPGGGCQPVVESALALGYRDLDTAAMGRRFNSRTHPTFRRHTCTQ